VDKAKEERGCGNTYNVDRQEEREQGIITGRINKRDKKARRVEGDKDTKEKYRGNGNYFS
jgi:hypothetical protein